MFSKVGYSILFSETKIVKKKYDICPTLLNFVNSQKFVAKCAEKAVGKDGEFRKKRYFSPVIPVSFPYSSRIVLPYASLLKAETIRKPFGNKNSDSGGGAEKQGTELFVKL